MPLRGRSFRGFPFDEEEGSDAWSDLLVRHPELATRLRPSTWGRKRRPSSQDGIDDSADNFRNFDRFPFNNIPAEFRNHFPADWTEFSPREEQRQQPPSPQHQTAATQTEAEAGPSQDHLQAHLPQYGLRNTVDLGQKSATDPSIVEGEDRSQRSVSAPPDNRQENPNFGNMSGQGNPEQPTHQPHEPHSNVRHIPIFVEGRDEPVINKDVDHGTHFADPKPAYVPPPQPHIEREQYYADDGPAGFPFSKGFDRPFFRQGAQPFTKQKMYPQAAAFARGASPQRSQSPKPSFQEQQHVPRTEAPTKPQQRQAPPPQRQTPPQQFKQAPPQRHATPPPQAHQPSPPPQPAPQPQQQAPSANDPISRILSIQTDVLNLMTEVENFTGTKKDKRYIYLDEMLTRNLIKLDDIETDGKENIRQARKEAIKCIQKCIAVLEAKAEGGSTAQPAQDVEMQATENDKSAENQEAVQNGDVEMKEPTKEAVETQEPPKESEIPQPEAPVQQPEATDEVKKEGENVEIKVDNTETPEAAVDTRPEETAQETDVAMKPEEQGAEKKSPKKTVKKRDKSKDKKKATKDKDSKTEESADKKEDVNNKGDVNENTVNNADVSVNKVEEMQVDAKSDKTQSMDVDGGAASQ
ncbi:BAG domain-containing protein Samui isoform X2 [Aricia agestis]|uniref:BAG domain-containing protein Samui isoform X2 n=1 Tax=Aricia agestis TaxID=91739 RepID=UPI001C20891E|nr:BAG domain-containing protein Samui isoform X2 [Aricia agestis]